MNGSRRWAMLALLGTAELLGMSLWFVAGAVGPWLSERWGLDATQLGWLTAAVQLGFVAGTALVALLNLADIAPARWLFSICAGGAAAINLALLAAPGYATALLLRFLVGTLLAGVYPPAMKMIATWFRDNRGLAIGTIVGALTIGKALPYLLRALPDPDPVRLVAGSSLAAAVGAILVAVGYRDGPHPFPRRPFDITRVASLLRHRETRLAIGGYLGHMWELYAMWTWIPVFLAATLPAGAPADAIAFGSIAVGGAGCVWGGIYADRRGRERCVNLAMGASAACCLLVGVVAGAPIWVVALLAWIWGFFVVADSAQFSAMVTEVTPAHAVGTALTLQTSLGFLLTIVTIQAVPLLEPVFGWNWVFLVLAPGPLLGIAAIRRLSRIRQMGTRAAEAVRLT